MFQITPMDTADLIDVMAIERVSQPEPWSERAFLEELNLPHSRVFVARMAEHLNPCLETDDSPQASGRHDLSLLCGSATESAQPTGPRKPLGAGTTLGYVCFWKVADEVQILNLAVHPSYRNQGIGRALLLHALKLAMREGATKAVLEVRKGNLEAQRLYGSVGFEKLGERPNYYDVIKEAALLMELQLNDGWESVRDPAAPAENSAI